MNEAFWEIHPLKIVNKNYYIIASSGDKTRYLDVDLEPTPSIFEAKTFKNRELAEKALESYYE